MGNRAQARSLLLLSCSHLAALGGMSAKSAGTPAGVTVAIWVVAVLLLLYALRKRRVGMLR